MIRTEENMTRNPFFFPWTNFPNLYSYNNYLKASDDCVSILLGKYNSCYVNFVKVVFEIRQNAPLTISLFSTHDFPPFPFLK